MDIQYEFNIRSVKRKLTLGDLKDVVIECDYNLNITTADNPNDIHYAGGSVVFDTSQLDSNSFVPFEDINKETIISWILQKENVSSLNETYFVKSELASFKVMYEETHSNVESAFDDWKVSDTIDMESVSFDVFPNPGEDIDTVGITTDSNPVG